MKYRTLPLLLVSALSVSVLPCPGQETTDKPLHKFLSSEDSQKQSHAYQWLDIMQQVTAHEVERNAPRPTVISRMMAIWATAVYDAWAAYDEKAVGSRLGSSLRRPKAEHTLENKQKAIAYASYHSLLYVFGLDKDFIDGAMRRMGFDPAVVSRDPTKPEGIGLLAAQAVIDYRRHDGANQEGDEIGCQAGVPYSDYTYYQPVNTADKVNDPDRWQPITFTLANGKQVTPGFLTPQWYRVKPFAIETSAQFRPPPPPKTTTDNELLKKETDQVLAYNYSLTNQEKAIVEFMRDGPLSTGQSGHWLRFAADVSRRDKHTLDQDVKLYFVVANVAMDAFISCWETKRFYDSSRPWTLVRHYYKGQKVKCWAGVAGGVCEKAAEEWYPYSPKSFITPPFPGYTSGHATVSGACAKIIAHFTGSDKFGFIERRRHCELTEQNAGEMMTIDMPTWSSVSELAALSRALGGYHIPLDNNVGLKVGRDIADWSWPKYQEYFNGTAKVRP